MRRRWMLFFFGSPRRFLGACAVLFVLFAMVAPVRAAQALSNVLSAFVMAVGPLAGPLIVIAIAVFGIKTIFKGLPGKKGK